MAEGGPTTCDQQKREICALLKSPLEKGDTWYLIDTKWFKQWKKYVGYDSWDTSFVGDQSAYPGPIDNGPLFKEGTSSNVLKERLIDELDYILVPTEAWNKLVNWYGLEANQEPIARKVIEQGMFVKHCKVEVYLMDLKLCQNNDMERSVTKQFSRADTIDEIEKAMRSLFSISTDDEVRLWNRYMSNTYEHLNKPENTVQDAGLYQGQVIVIERKNEDGSWPRPPKKNTSYSYTNSYSSNTYSGYNGSYDGYSAARGSSSPGLCGLSNLGNTCFMNSAIQCMSNVPPLTNYFLVGTFHDELNYDNPLGMKGEIASNYAELIQLIWSGKHSYTAPRNFKVAVGRFAPQFSGYQQQDSQELMAFLLDGLHEDLNRIKKKPYIELNASEGRTDEEVAKEAWSNYRKRNDSIIVDTFHGLLKSTLVCPECSKISVTFDPFCYLSLPLPIRKERQIEVFYVPMDPMKKTVQYKLTVPKLGIVQDLCNALSKLSSTPTERMLVTDVYNHRFHKVYTVEEGLNHILDRDDIFIYEIPTCPNEDPDTVILPVYMREMKERPDYNNHRSVSRQLFGQPLLIAVPRQNCTYDVLYNTVLNRLCRFVTVPEDSEEWWKEEGMKTANGEVDMSHSDDDSDNTAVDDASNKSSSKDTVNSDDIEDLINEQERRHRLFSFCIVNSYGSAEIEQIQDDGRLIRFSSRSYLAIDWLDQAKAKFYNDKVAEEIDVDDSVNARPSQRKQVIQLDECLQLFTTTEKLGAEDPWYCPRCKIHQQATKKFDLWSLPKTLVIHLKRFSYNRYWRDKLDTLIEFPIRGLNMKKYLINRAHGPALYDLIAVSNHFGGMGGGHYTAYAKNKEDGQWYNFDDSSVSQANEDAIVTRAAYVLVYHRREPHSEANYTIKTSAPAALGFPDDEGNYNNGASTNGEDDMEIN